LVDYFIMKPSPMPLKYHARRRQGGAVLVVGLIILVILTLLGVQAMRSNVLQERMAGNMRERNLAFQAAESALRLGEANGPFDSANADLAGDLANWDGTGASGVVAAFDDSVSANPQFHVGPPQAIRIGASLPPKFRYLYPTTARGVGRQDTSVVVVQSIYEPVD
jgi:type IV pilus assembly protein PilX